MFTLPYKPEDPHNFETWAHVFDRVREGEMPPKKEDQPSEKERRELLDQLRLSLTAMDRQKVETEGRVRGRRLTRVEYEHTLHDLLGIRIPLGNKLPADESDKEFETVAEAQQLSHFHLNQYLNVADLALSEAFGGLLEGDKPYKRSYTAKELTKPSRGNYRGPQFRDGKAIMWAMRLQFAGRMTPARAPESGWYRITIKNLRGVNPGPDGSVWGTLRTGTCYSDEPILYYASTLEGVAQPKDHVCVAWMNQGHILELKPNEGTNKVVNVGRGGNLIYNGKDLQKQGAAGLVFDGITMERVYPGGSRPIVQQRLFPGIRIEKGRAQFGNKPEAIRQLVHRFASRAFRRPVEATTVAPYQPPPTPAVGAPSAGPSKSNFLAIILSARILYGRLGPSTSPCVWVSGSISIIRDPVATTMSVGVSSLKG